MKSRFLLTIFVLMSAISMAGCNSLNLKNQADKLERSVTGYASALRWAHYRQAASLHVTRDGKFAEVDLEYLENYGVTSLNVISQTIIPSSEKGGMNEAAIVAEMSYFHKEQGTVRKLRLNQIWWYNAEVNQWLIESEFPKFK